MYRNPHEVEKELRSITDGIGLPMDEGIIRYCVILNSLGYKTRQSCEGHEDRYSTYPWIDLIWNEEKSKGYLDKSYNEFFNTVYLDLEEYYKNSKSPHDCTVSFFKFGDEDELIIRLAQTTDVKIFGNNRAEKIKEYLKEIQNFCEFLNKKYNLNY